jgi:predicted Fe-Mo cluster-binding NifX family protein
MKIGIPIFKNRVSPRFDFSPEIWVIEVEKGDIVRQEKLFTGGFTLSRRLEQLASMKVDKVICGGIDLFSRDQLDSWGIDVVHDVIGDAEIIFNLFMKGKLRHGLCCERKRVVFHDREVALK